MLRFMHRRRVCQAYNGQYYYVTIKRRSLTDLTKTGQDKDKKQTEIASIESADPLQTQKTNSKACELEDKPNDRIIGCEDRQKEEEDEGGGIHKREHEEDGALADADRYSSKDTFLLALKICLVFFQCILKLEHAPSLIGQLMYIIIIDGLTNTRNSIRLVV